jgi:hypothetical protein
MAKIELKEIDVDKIKPIENEEYKITITSDGKELEGMSSVCEVQYFKSNEEERK